MDLDPNEMEERKKMAVGMCTCKQCPSFKACGESIGYCFPTIRRSSCIKQEMGCICGSCPVTAHMGLRHDYYCTRGSEKEQDEK